MRDFQKFLRLMYTYIRISNFNKNIMRTLPFYKVQEEKETQPQVHTHTINFQVPCFYCFYYIAKHSLSNMFFDLYC